MNIIIRIERVSITIVQSDQDTTEDHAESKHTSCCSVCGWQRDYQTAEQAKRGLAAHYAHCPGPESDDFVNRLFNNE